MATIIDTVNMAINMGGFHSGLANPGQWIPEITEPVVAVSLESVHSQTNCVTVRAEVVSPVALGGQRCQEAVLRLVDILHRMGADCRITGCDFEPKTEQFRQAVLAEFYGDILDESWTSGKACRVNWGGTQVAEPLSFTAWREGNAEMPMTLCQWHFRMEENLDGSQQEASALDPFTIRVMAGNVTEVYTGCTVTSQERRLADGRLRQIRQGTATAKE